MVRPARTIHQLGDDHKHKTWNRQQPPVLTITPGEQVSLKAPDASDGELTRDSTTHDIAQIEPHRDSWRLCSPGLMP